MKNARKECVGKPRRCVAAFRPFELTAIRISGNDRGGIQTPGWRNVRTIDRCAINPI
jgi:hypothetical protein